MAPWLTVVVPIHDVAPYLPECLASIARQTHRELDVILVDDGSTDASAAIAGRFVATDGRFRLVRRPNGGLGTARNTGASIGDGDYLSFVDGDDVLPPYAFSALVGALEHTGSDFATGDVALLTEGGLRPSRLHRGTHRETRLAVRLVDRPDLLYDRLACNKVFRRAFWDKHGLRFPDRVHYEDIPVIVPAYALASGVDVLAVPVYRWRQRPATDPSISRRLGEPRNLADRFAAVTSARRSLAAIDPALVARYDETALRSDLRMILDLVPSASPAYRHRFFDLACDYLSDVDPTVVDRLPAALRDAWRLVQRRLLPELVNLLARSSGGDRVPRHPYAVCAVSWDPGGALRLSGSAPGRLLPRPGLVWLSGGRGRRAVRPFVAWRGRFSVTLDACRLGPGEWTANAGLPRGKLGTGDARPALPGRWVAAARRVVPLVRAGVLRLDVTAPVAAVRRVGVRGGAVVIEGSGAMPGEVRLELVAGVPWAAYPVCEEGAGWSVRVPLVDLAGYGGAAPVVGDRPPRWRVTAAEEPLAVGPSVPETRSLVGDDALLVAGADDDGTLRLCLLPAGPWVEDVRMRRDGALVLAGALPSHGWPGLRVGLRTVDGDAPELEVAAGLAGDRWLAELPVAGVATGDRLPTWRPATGGVAADLRFASRVRRALPRTAGGLTIRADAHCEVVTL